MLSWKIRYSEKDPWAVEGDEPISPRIVENNFDAPVRKKKLPEFTINPNLRGQAFFDDFTEQIKKRRELNGSDGYEELEPGVFAQATRDHQKLLGLYGQRDGKNASIWWKRTREQNWETQHRSELAMGEIHPDQMYKTPCKPNCMSRVCRAARGELEDSIPDNIMDKANELLDLPVMRQEQKKPQRMTMDDLKRQLGLDDD